MVDQTNVARGGGSRQDTCQAPVCLSVYLSVCVSISVRHLSQLVRVVIELFTKRHKSHCRRHRSRRSATQTPLKPTVMISNLQLICVLLLLHAICRSASIQPFCWFFKTSQVALSYSSRHNNNNNNIDNFSLPTFP